MTTANDVILSWLSDAYSMENALVKILQGQLNDAKNEPAVEARLKQHLEVTKQHAQMVKSTIERLGGSTSTTKTWIGELFGMLQGPSTGVFQDKVVKDALADFAAENFEVASYTSLITAAQEVGDTETVNTLQTIRQQDQDMANWLKEHIPNATRQAMQKMAGTSVG